MHFGEMYSFCAYAKIHLSSHFLTHLPTRFLYKTQYRTVVTVLVPLVRFQESLSTFWYLSSSHIFHFFHKKTLDIVYQPVFYFIFNSEEQNFFIKKFWFGKNKTENQIFLNTSSVFIQKYKLIHFPDWRMMNTWQVYSRHFSLDIFDFCVQNL